MDTVSLLRSFPHALDHRQQLAFSTLSHLLETSVSQQAFQHAFMQQHSGKGDDELSIADRSAMLSSLWATVSTLYFIDKVCRCDPDMLLKVYGHSALPTLAPPVANLRNARDHIAQRIGNFSRSTNLPPINGLVRWTFNPRIERDEFVIGVQVFTVDPMLKGFSVTTGEGIDIRSAEYDNLALYAFDDCLHVSRAHEELLVFSNNLGKQLVEAVEVAEQAGAPKKTTLSEAEQRPFCVVMEGRSRITPIGERRS